MHLAKTRRASAVSGVAIYVATTTVVVAMFGHNAWLPQSCRRSARHLNCPTTLRSCANSTYWLRLLPRSAVPALIVSARLTSFTKSTQTRTAISTPVGFGRETRMRAHPSEYASASIERSKWDRCR